MRTIIAMLRGTRGINVINVFYPRLLMVPLLLAGSSAAWLLLA